MIPQMSVHWLNVRLFLTLFVALFGAIILFLRFSQTSSLSFHQQANGPFSSGGDSLQDVFNQTLGVSTTDTFPGFAGSRHRFDL